MPRKQSVIIERGTEPNAGIIADLKSGMQSAFWQTLREICEQDLIELDRVVLEDESITPEIREDLRRKRYYLKYFITLPETKIKLLEGKTEMPELDPYQKN